MQLALTADREVASGKPVLKWAGGKAQLLPILRQVMPRKFVRYAEPFLGGGAFFFDLAKEGAIASDSNAELIQFYSVVRDCPDELLDAVRSLPVTKDDFYRIRALKPESLSAIERAGRFVYLNKTCYNGLHRVNKKGQFNTPFGGRTDITICDQSSIMRASSILKTADLRCCSYEQTLEQLQPGDFVYLDPPYIPLGGYSDFSRYTRHFFREPDQQTLANRFAELSERGVYALLSNSANPKTEMLYKSHFLLRVRATRQINCKAAGRGHVTEFLIANYPLGLHNVFP